MLASTYLPTYIKTYLGLVFKGNVLLKGLALVLIVDDYSISRLASS